MKICIVTNEFPALTETFITTKALELSRRGHAVTVIKNQDSKIVNESHVAQVRKAGITIVSYNALQSKNDVAKAFTKYPALVLQSMSFSPASFKKRFRQHLQNKILGSQAFDIIHFEFSGLGVVYEKMLDSLQAKLVVSCRGTAEKVKPISEPGRKDLLTKLFTKVDGIHCVSQDMADTITPYCLQPEKIFVNRPSIDPAVFNRKAPYVTNIGALQILTIGRFTFQKGYLIGLMAMKLLADDGVDFKWTIVADGPQKEEVLYHVHALQMQDRVELVGKKNRDEILALYNSIDVFLLTSVYEGIANVCLEAMSMELPVISTRSGGMEEVIVHGSNGLLCEVYNPASIAENVRRLHQNRGQLKVMGTNARATILERFTISRQVDVFEEKYSALIN